MRLTQDFIISTKGRSEQDGFQDRVYVLLGVLYENVGSTVFYCLFKKKKVNRKLNNTLSKKIPTLPYTHLRLRYANTITFND